MPTGHPTPVSDEQILSAIEQIIDLPTANSLARHLTQNGLSCSNKFISSRLGSNPDLQTQMEARGRSIIASASEQEIFKNISSKKWYPGVIPDYATALIYQRVDYAIRSAIEQIIDLPTTSSLARHLTQNGLSCGAYLISSRLGSNPDLFFAYYTKRGLSQDQITSLMLEKMAQNEQLKAGVEQRLPHLSVFRQMLAVVSHHLTIFGGSPAWVLEIGHYPAPYYEALRAAGDPQPHSGYCDIRPILKGENIHYADSRVPAVLLPESIHRIKDPEPMTALFREVGRVLQDGGIAVCTYPAKYSSNALQSSLDSAGFTVLETGRLHTFATPEILRDYPDAAALLEKLDSRSDVLVLMKTAPASPNKFGLPILEKSQNKNGEGREFIPSRGLEVPEGINEQLAHLYSRRIFEGRGDALLLSVVDKEGNELDLFGYNMDPRRPQTPEHAPVSRAGPDAFRAGLDALQAAKVMERIMARAAPRNNPPAANPLRLEMGRITRIEKGVLLRLI